MATFHKTVNDQIQGKIENQFWECTNGYDVEVLFWIQLPDLPKE